MKRSGMEENQITLEPGKRSGQPCIRGLRITVWDVLDWLAAGMSEKEILADYPELGVIKGLHTSVSEKS